MDERGNTSREALFPPGVPPPVPLPGTVCRAIVWARVESVRPIRPSARSSVKTRITITLDVELLRAARAVAAAEGRPVSALLTD